MSDIKLNPEKIANAILTLEKVLGAESLSSIEERAVLVKGASQSSYKEDLIRCEKVNEQNYNSGIPLMTGVRDSFSSIKEVAEILAKRDLETTKTRENDGSGVNVVDAVSALRPR